MSQSGATPRYEIGRCRSLAQELETHMRGCDMCQAVLTLNENGVRAAWTEVYTYSFDLDDLNSLNVADQFASAAAHFAVVKAAARETPKGKYRCRSLTTLLELWEAWIEVAEDSWGGPRGMEVVTYMPSEEGKNSKAYPNGAPVCLAIRPDVPQALFTIASTAGPDHHPYGDQGEGHYAAWNAALWKGSKRTMTSGLSRGPQGTGVASPHSSIFSLPTWKLTTTGPVTVTHTFHP
jgi:hypothetical protein